MVTSDFNVRFMRYGFLKKNVAVFLVLIKAGKGLISIILQKLYLPFIRQKFILEIVWNRDHYSTREISGIISYRTGMQLDAS